MRKSDHLKAMYDNGQRHSNNNENKTIRILKRSFEILFDHDQTG